MQAVSGNVQFGNGGTSGNMAGSLSMLSGGSVTFDRSDDFIYSGSISGGTFVKNGAGRLIATGSLSTIGNSLNSGVLQIGNGSSSGTISGNIINNALLELNRPDAFTYGGSISGTGSLTVSGSGTFTLSGSNSYSGQTLLSAGTLKAGSTMAFGNNSALTVATGAS